MKNTKKKQESVIQTPVCLDFPCPFCGQGSCYHFIGWTEDGCTYSFTDEKVPLPMMKTDKMVSTGVSARVYRDTAKLLS